MKWANIPKWLRVVIWVVGGILCALLMLIMPMLFALVAMMKHG